MDNTTFVVHKDWLRSIEDLPLDQQDKIIAEFVRYGCGMELEYDDDVIVHAFVKMLKGRIDYSKSKYAEKVEAGQFLGRKKKIDDAAVYALAREGKGSREIASLMGVSKSSIDHCDGWRRRGEDFEFF